MSALQIKLAEGEAALRAALLGGKPTTALRQAISTIKVELAREVQNEAAAHADVDAERQADIAERTRLLTEAANTRINKILDADTAPDSI